MLRYVSIIALAAFAAPTIALAQDATITREYRAPAGGAAADTRGGGADFDLAEYVLSQRAAARGHDAAAHSAIQAACDGGYIITYRADGSIEDWDCT